MVDVTEKLSSIVISKFYTNNCPLQPSETFVIVQEGTQIAAG